MSERPTSVRLNRSAIDLLYVADGVGGRKKEERKGGKKSVPPDTQNRLAGPNSRL